MKDQAAAADQAADSAQSNTLDQAVPSSDQGDAGELGRYQALGSIDDLQQSLADLGDLRKKAQSLEAGVDNAAVEKLAEERAAAKFAAVQKSHQTELKTERSAKTKAVRRAEEAESALRRARLDIQFGDGVREAGVKMPTQALQLMVDKAEKFATFEDGGLVFKHPKTGTVLEGAEGPMTRKEAVLKFRDAEDSDELFGGLAWVFQTDGGGSGFKASGDPSMTPETLDTATNLDQFEEFLEKVH